MLSYGDKSLKLDDLISLEELKMFLTFSLKVHTYLHLYVYDHKLSKATGLRDSMLLKGFGLMLGIGLLSYTDCILR